MRRLSLAASFIALGLGGLAFAGPGVDKRAAYLHAETRDSSNATARLLREARSLLTPLLGTPRTPARLELISDRARFEELARAAGQPDATVFADFERHALVALDLEVDAARARVVIHEAARLHVAEALGARAAPWFEEGLACCAEDAWLQRVELGAERPDTDRAARARFELRSGASVERVLALGSSSFERGPRVHRDVAVAWIAVRHLLQGGSRSSRGFDAYVHTLRSTGNEPQASRALAAVLPATDLDRALISLCR